MVKFFRYLVLIFGVMLCWPLVTSAQNTTGESVDGGSQGASSDQVTLNLQDVDIRALINTVSEITGKNFIVDPRVKGKVTLVSGGPLDAEQIYEVFLSVLQVHNFSAVPSGTITKIIPSNIVKQEPTPTTDVEIPGAGDDQITQVYKLKHASAQELIPVLRPLVPPTSHFVPHGPTNTLVFTDTAANVQRILDIIARIDVPDRRSNVRVIFLKYAKAAELTAVLTQLATNMTAVTGEGVANPNRVSVHADTSTNALVISAPDDEYRLLQAVIDQLDIQRESQKDIHVLYLKYAKASDLVTILNEVSQGIVADAEGQIDTTRNVSVQAEEGSNALVIHARPDDFESIKSVVEQLDIKRKQVFVEAIIAEVSFNKAADLGIEWQASTNDVTVGGEATASTSFSTITGGLTLGFINQFVINAAGAVVPDLQVILRALRSDSHTNIISTPNLLTLDNESAEITVGQEVPFITGQFTSDAADGGGDNVVDPFQTIERRDVGLQLKVTPQINAGDTVTLEVEQEISSVNTTTVQGAVDLVTDERRISATVQVESGQIIVIGGLIRDDVLDTVEWVPILGRLPIIGDLFKRKRKSAIKTNLMVFLRPKIIENASALALSTKKKYDYIRELSTDSQPGTKRIIHKSKPPVLPEVEDWSDPDVNFEPKVIKEGPGMFP